MLPMLIVVIIFRDERPVGMVAFLTDLMGRRTRPRRRRWKVVVLKGASVLGALSGRQDYLWAERPIGHSQVGKLRLGLCIELRNSRRG